MYYSKYNYLFKSSKYGFLLFNAETNSFAELTEELYNTLERVKLDNKYINNLENDLIKQLVMAKIVTSENDNNFFYEKRLMYYFRSFTNKTLGLAIAPTTYCNFACPYCYEHNRLPIFMDEKIETDLVSFIKKHKNIDEVDITWYGGEPLLGIKSIKRILKQIKDENIPIRRHGMITNGYLLNEENSAFFKDYNLNYIQITLDGDKKSHDSRRVLSNGKGTFDKIIHNIDIFKKYNPDTFVSIRVNLDETNKSRYTALNNMVRERWKDNNIGIYPAFVQDFSDGCTSCDMISTNSQVQFYIDLYKNYNIPVNFYSQLHIGGCGATNLNYYVVGPKGELYKCWNDIGVKDKVVGFLDKEMIPNKNVLSQYLAGPTMFDDISCQNCNIFPICSGGCEWLRLENIKNGTNYNLCSSRKENLEILLESHYEKRKISQSV
ncbi:radical SAM protein [Dysgonomonas termitidis]|uniref:Radical SAM protein n=1 Tax=Dysgonomonas termitidis TaxID=1516126 RepID=A0ABV9KZ07_9BACT